MFKHHLTGTDYAIITANLIPLYGVLFMNWEAATMFLVYCLETIFIGFFNVIKMFIVNFIDIRNDQELYFGEKRPLGGWLLILFFICHYGIFVFIQTQIFFHTGNFFEDSSFIVGYKKVFYYLGNDGRLMLLIFLVSYTLQTFFSFAISGQYKKISLNRLMFQPYSRIIIQQFVVILGSIFLTLGGGKIFMLLFVMIKIFFEVFINLDKYLLIAENKSLNKKY